MRGNRSLRDRSCFLSGWGKVLRFQGGQAECFARGRICTLGRRRSPRCDQVVSCARAQPVSRVQLRTIDMKRVLLLVFLIVSLVQLDWERNRIYLWSSFAALLLMLWTELSRRRKVPRASNDVV